MKLAITGANGHLGQRMIREIDPQTVRALVRRQAAADQLSAAHPQLDVRVVDYLDPSSMMTALAGVDKLLHLVGILKESRSSTYQAAHEGATEVLLAAAAQCAVVGIVNVSILGAKPDHDNACLASKGRADRMLLQGSVAARVIRVPMVLGEGDYAALDLTRRAGRSLNVAFRAASLDQPIYAGDLTTAIRRALDGLPENRGALDLAGPEALSKQALNQRAAAVLGRRTRTLSLPIGVGLAVAWALERLPNPPLTRTMLEVLNQDDVVDVSALGLDLKPLDETLALVLNAAPARHPETAPNSSARETTAHASNRPSAKPPNVA